MTRLRRNVIALVAICMGGLIALAAVLFLPVPRDEPHRTEDERMIESLVRKFLYYPVVNPPDAAPPPWSDGAEEVRFPASDGNTIHGLYWPAPAGRPTVLFLHGNAQSVFEWALVHRDLADLDAGLLLIDYPGYGKSTGKPAEDALYAAGDAAMAWLLARQVAPEQVVVFGKSLGGGVASFVAAGHEVMGLVLESTFCSIPAVARNLFPFFPEKGVLRSERYATAERLPSIHCPVLVIHGRADELIPFAQGEELFAKANEPKSFYPVDGGGHNDVSMVAGADYGARIRTWLDSIRK